VTTLLFAFLKFILPMVLYMAWVTITIASVVYRVEWGLLLILFLAPQPNLYYQFYVFPMGSNMIDISMVGIVFGLIYQRGRFEIIGSFTVVAIYLILSYISLWIVSINFSLPIPFTPSNPVLTKWKDFAAMIFMYFLAVNVLKNEDAQKRALWIICFVLLFIGTRGFRSFTPAVAFSADSRYEGPFWRLNLGSNHYGAFMAHYVATYFGCFLVEENKWLRLFFGITIFFCLYAVLFSYSRGAYLAAVLVLFCYGVIHKHSLLILVGVLLLTWNTILPTSVVERINMTTTTTTVKNGITTTTDGLEHSASSRVALWDKAFDLFVKHPIVGVGYNGFQLTMIHTKSFLTDTHNYYLKVLCEQGLIGITWLFALLLTALRQGWRLYRIGSSPFYRGLGLGFLGTTISIMSTNLFGDRWSYFSLGCYFWVLLGMVDRGIINCEAIKIPSFEKPLVAPPPIQGVLAAPPPSLSQVRLEEWLHSIQWKKDRR